MANAPTVKYDSLTMNRIIRHIALFSLLVFAYPIAFMTFHVLHDHVPDASCVHNCCQHSSQTNQEGNPEATDQTQVSENSHCLICEYEFAKTEVTPAKDSPKVETYLCNSAKDLYRQIFVAFSGNNKSLRAPPTTA
jgi:hypothetical protein